MGVPSVMISIGTRTAVAFLFGQKLANRSKVGSDNSDQQTCVTPNI